MYFILTVKSRRATITASASAKRRQATEMRKGVQSHGAFAARAHKRENVSELPDFESLFGENAKQVDRKASVESWLLGERTQSNLLTKITRKGSIRPDGKNIGFLKTYQAIIE